MALDPLGFAALGAASGARRAQAVSTADQARLAALQLLAERGALTNAGTPTVDRYGALLSQGAGIDAMRLGGANAGWGTWWGKMPGIAQNQMVGLAAAGGAAFAERRKELAKRGSGGRSGGGGKGKSTTSGYEEWLRNQIRDARAADAQRRAITAPAIHSYTTGKLPVGYLGRRTVRGAGGTAKMS